MKLKLGFRAPRIHRLFPMEYSRTSGALYSASHKHAILYFASVKEGMLYGRVNRTLVVKFVIKFVQS